MTPPRKSSCPLENFPPKGWTICDTLIFATIAPLAALFLLGWLANIFLN